MTALTPPRHPVVDSALTVAKRWCAGRVIDDRPALAHAVRVAVAIGAHQPRVKPQIIAAALLHDGPEFAPPNLDLNHFLTYHYGGEVTRLIRGMQAEHEALDAETPFVPDRTDTDFLLLSTADKLVALTSLMRRARLSGDVTGFFAIRQPLLRLLDHFRACQRSAIGVAPASLTRALGQILNELDAATASNRR